MGLTRLLQLGKARQIAHQRQVAGITQAQVRGQQLSALDPLDNMGKQLVRRLVEARRQRHRLVIAALDAEHRFHIEQRAQAQCRTAHLIQQAAAIALLKAALTQVGKVVGDNKGTGLQGQLLQASTHGIRVRALGNQAHALGRQHRHTGKHTLTVDHPHGERPTQTGLGPPRPVLLQEAKGGLGGMLEDLAALAGHGQAQQIVELVDQLIQQPLLQLRHRQWLAMIEGADPRQILLIEHLGGLRLALIDQPLLTHTQHDGQHPNPVRAQPRLR